MIIDQLYELSSPDGNDELPLERDTLTYKIKWKNLGGDAIAVLQGDMEQAQEDINDLNAALDSVCLQAARVDVSGGGTTTHTLTGLTTNHVVGNWGMFTDSTMTTAIPENAPTCDIEITTGADGWTMVISNYSSAFSIRPTFILKQN